jgi:hypothetical protein
VIAPESAHANYRNIDGKFRAQMNAPEPRNNALLSQFQPAIGKRKPRQIFNSCHPERSRAKGEAIGPAQSKDPYSF